MICREASTGQVAVFNDTSEEKGGILISVSY